MAPMPDEHLPFFVINALNMGKRSRMAAITLLGYDHLVTLDREVSLIWFARKDSLGFYLFVFNRFFSLAYLIYDSVPLTKSGLDHLKCVHDVGVISAIFAQHNIKQICVIYLMCNDIVTLVQTLLMQVILQLRVYALYERSKSVLLLLLAMCALEMAAMASLVGVTIGNLEHLPIASTPTGCYYRGLLELSALFWVPGLIFEPILCILVIYKAWSPKNPSRSIPLVATVARDSLLYFIAIFAILLCSTIIWAVNPTYINMVMPWSAALPSILGSRLLLNMREKVYQSGEMKSYIVESMQQTPHNTLSTLMDNDSVTTPTSPLRHAHVEGAPIMQDLGLQSESPKTSEGG
ncbi:hypothetical protein EIP91_005341 [Steccherinum ochraceum]|uniref:DUF6533 domain-containing protein n=1 Tax=Steccherinum ochraceum TaxID=92696 RepID=A0A4R0RIB1_9APHY|nr:hypothetical protein EIP91_005341 [Steccherinum ochraceum]